MGLTSLDLLERQMAWNVLAVELVEGRFDIAPAFGIFFLIR
jgi:hypothetical protein